MTHDLQALVSTLGSYQDLFGPYHPQTLAVTTVLAVELCASGRRMDGRRLLERAVVDLTKYHGKHHPLRMRALEEWSVLLCQEREWHAVLPVQRELLDCRTHVLGPDHPDSLALRRDLSATLSLLTNTSLAISA
jgi:eukaryotic-like serine/threonine-protein kinase